MKSDLTQGVENPAVVSLESLAARVAACFVGERLLVALVGPPGSGKTTTGDALRDELQRQCRSNVQIVPMDGFHYDNAVLKERRLMARKGAPETFDVGSLEHVLMRLSTTNSADVAVPVFDRNIDLARASARIISRKTGIIIVEGNYLLLRDEPWNRLRQYFDLSIMIDCDERTLRARLMKRWLDLGHAEAEATVKVETNDLPNAKRVLADSVTADIVFISPNRETAI